MKMVPVLAESYTVKQGWLGLAPRQAQDRHQFHDGTPSTPRR
jgi:hypothetical protein